MTPLAGWENFYVVVGSSAGALIGLQFVVLTLIADTSPSSVDAGAAAAFATPSVVHFGAVLLLSALVSAPWSGMGVVAVLWGLMGLCGAGYALMLVRRMRAQTAYRPVFEDWLFHVLVPCAAYAAMIVSALLARSLARPALFLIGAASLLLLFSGIHNAWDAVTYHILVMRRRRHGAERQE